MVQLTSEENLSGEQNVPDALGIRRALSPVSLLLINTLRVFLQGRSSTGALPPLPSLLVCFPRRLDANHISYVPPSCFSGLHSLRHLWLDDNALTEIPVQAFRSLSALQAMTLALNKIHHIPDYAFGNLSSLVVL